MASSERNNLKNTLTGKYITWTYVEGDIPKFSEICLKVTVKFQCPNFAKEIFFAPDVAKTSI